MGTGTFPSQHGITGHNIRDGSKVRKAYGDAGHANPGDIFIPTLADLWSDATDNGAWIGEIGYQVWHMGMIGHGGPTRTGAGSPVGVYWDEGAYKQNGVGVWAPHNPDLFRMPTTVPGLDVYDAHLQAFDSPEWDTTFDPKGRQTPCCAPPVVRYQGDLIEATLRSEPIGQSGVTDLLYINYKAPDYTGHIYNMKSQWEGLVLEEVDAQLGRLVATLDELFPNDYVLIVTADHGQCPLPDDVDGVRLDPVQLAEEIDQRFGGELVTTVQSVVPSEIYLHEGVLGVNGVHQRRRRGRPATIATGNMVYVLQSAIVEELLETRVGGVLHDVPRIARGRGPVGVRRDHVHRRNPPPGPETPRRPMAVELTAEDREMLDGGHGEAAALAMRILLDMGRVWEAERLIDVTSAHIDSCLYHGPAGLDFAELLLTGGAHVSIPTTLNVSSLDLLHPGLVRLDAETSAQARRLMDAYVAMGCRPTWTCAPYQLERRPLFGEHVAWAESERDRVRELGAGRAHQPLRRLHRHLRGDHRTRAGRRPASRRAAARQRRVPAGGRRARTAPPRRDHPHVRRTHRGHCVRGWMFPSSSGSPST